MKLFEFAVIYNPLPTKDQNDRGEKPKSELIVDITRVLAGDEKEAAMLAARAIPDAYTSKLDRMEIARALFKSPGCEARSSGAGGATSAEVKGLGSWR